ncbi:MAG: hypothetical protein AB2693_17395, partial [Candidatus Thiodiazotropha sp.]
MAAKQLNLTGDKSNDSVVKPKRTTFLYSVRGNDAKRARQDSSEQENSVFVCQKCDRHIEEGINCVGCKLLFCLKCAGVSATLYKCIVNGELESFHWNCKCCNSTFPSLENISVVLQNMQSKYDDRMTGIEKRMDAFEENIHKRIKDNVYDMKDEIVSSIREDVDRLVDSRNKELEERKRRELNITLFNLPEHSNSNGNDNKREDERDFTKISSELGLDNVNIVTSFRLGRKQVNKIRPLKVILAEKAHRKFLLDNAKFISSKVNISFRNVIISKDLTQQQRDDRRKMIASRKQAKEPIASSNRDVVSRVNISMNRDAAVHPSYKEKNDSKDKSPPRHFHSTLVDRH